MAEVLGANYLGGGRCEFTVWAPLAERVELCLSERVLPVERSDNGYYHVTVEDIKPGALYFYQLDGRKRRPDPASRAQPEGVHGPSRVVNPDFPWTDHGWSGFPLADYVLYELHVGAFTEQGTFEAVIPHLAELKSLGITVIELMPVAQFPGERNWGYDGVFPYAVQNSYGGARGLKALVNACHEQGLGVALDVVYNHLGPEGNYLADFGPYFTGRYRTPWAQAINYDGPESDEVRRFFIENALYWVTQFHIDALRLDAIEAIFDHSARPFLEELTSAVHQRAQQLNRRIYVTAESDLNDARVVRPRELGGYGLDAQWNDNFHHALHTLITGERDGYYCDFGELNQLATAYREGFVYSGQYSHFRRRRYGNSSQDVPAQRFIVCAQNHDQVGNRMLGERLSTLVPFEALKLAAGAVLLSPFIPLLFMGEEYGETAPFLYFTSHSDEKLAEAVRRGRRQEFVQFAWKGEPADPQKEATFLDSKLKREVCRQEHRRVLLDFYRELIRLRKNVPALANLSKENLVVLAFEEKKILFVRRWRGESHLFLAFNFGDTTSASELPVPPGQWRKLLDSSDDCWKGSGSLVAPQLQSEGELRLQLRPKSFIMYRRS